MAAWVQKPLPPIPKHSAASSLITLNVDARDHLSQFIKHSLNDGNSCFSEVQRDDWQRALEAVLDDLGDNFARAGWLTGIKRCRIARLVEADDEAKSKVRQIDKKPDGTGAVPRSNSEDSTGSESLESPEIGNLSPFSKPYPKQSQPANTSLALNQLRDLMSKPAPPTPKPSPKHLLLSIAPLGSQRVVPEEDSGFNIIPANIGCSFIVGVFSLPDTNVDPGSVIISGLGEWDTETLSLNGEPVRLVGGTFQFKGVNSPVEHHTLFKALQLAVHVHLALLLEQHVLVNSNAQLEFPKPRFAPISPTPHLPRTLERHTTEIRQKSRNSFFPSGIMSFLSKKASGIGPRTNTLGPILGRGGSLDLSMAIPSSLVPGPRSSEDGLGRLHRFSFISDSRPSLLRSTQSKEENDLLFTSIVETIEGNRHVLSTSAGVTFDPPTLIMSLAEKERKFPSRRLKGDEKAGLSSILGWEGKAARASGMSGTVGFVRQQGFSVLFSKYVPPTIPPSNASADTPSHKTLSDPPKPIALSLCGTRHWVTYRYFSRNRLEDRTLGDAIEDLSSSIGDPCETHSCQFKRGEHEMRLVHGGVRIVLSVYSGAILSLSDNTSIKTWLTCEICGAETTKQDLTDGTYLFSFAKFLELLVYSPLLCVISPPLCDHTTPPPRPRLQEDTPLPRSRFNIVRHFSYQASVVRFSISAIENIFELRVPRLQIIKGHGLEKGVKIEGNASSKESIEAIGEEEKKVLKREIKAWWEGMADRMDKLEEKVLGDDLDGFRKALPRLPSDDSSFEEGPIPESDPPGTPTTPRPKVVPLAPSTTEDSSSFSSSSSRPEESLAETSDPPSEQSESSNSQNGPIVLLSNLRHQFQHTEQLLYAQLNRTPPSHINDVRRSFLSAARGSARRLQAWQRKHLRPVNEAETVEKQLPIEEPEWWGKHCHAVPGGNVIVREGDWGSIIAFTLSTSDYHRELASLSGARTATSPTQIPQTPLPSPVLVNPSSFFSNNKLFKTPGHHEPDPDLDEAIWHQPEEYSAVICRKQHPRDPTSLLSLREVLRQRPAVEGSGGPSLSRLSGQGGSTSRSVSTAPPATWAKPAVEVSKQAATGEVSGLPDGIESAGKMLQEMDASIELSRPGSVMSGTHTSSSGFVEAHIRRGKASSIMSVESELTVGPDNGSSPPTPPSKDEHQSTVEAENQPTSLPETTSSFASAFTNSLTTAMRYVLSTGDAQRPASSLAKNHHGLLTTDCQAIDERPHIKYDWTIGKRLKFSCTAYYAKQFDGLRRRCGIGAVYLQSLSRSANWAAEGGKSKSNFWKTSDDRFIIKTLVNAWAVADLQVLIDLAPSYFRYMDTTASNPTVLAKLLGFYTVEIRNLESGTVQARADLLVMENLFYEQNVSKTFDLKGIQGRKVKTSSNEGDGNHKTKTLFDGEWIEGQQRSLLLVHPHSKVVLRDAIRSDCDFLSKSNIMDYSLLLGVDEGKRQIACGLVDTIGSYTFAKTLEYKAKQGLNSGKQVTVIPPAEYQERFENALESYFLACPDKWSKPLDETKVVSDINLLPSVL